MEENCLDADEEDCDNINKQDCHLDNEEVCSLIEEEECSLLYSTDNYFHTDDAACNDGELNENIECPSSESTEMICKKVFEEDCIEVRKEDCNLIKVGNRN